MSGPDFPGATVLSSDSRYAALCTGFNQRFSGTPAYVQVCGSPGQVVDAVQSAIRNGLRPTVRSGGHCYEGFVTDGAGAIIDLSPMNSVYQDLGMDGAFCVEAGCTLWDVYTQLYRQYGLTIPGGSCYSVGAGGHICGGGYGLLSRKFGLVVDYLCAIEVVCVSAQGNASLILASPSSPDPEIQALFWAHTGGGGGNFGVVTRYWFAPDLPQAPAVATLSSVAWNWSGFTFAQFSRLLQNFGAFFAEHSAPDDPYRDLFSLLHLTKNAAPQIVMVTQYVGNDLTLLDDFLAAISNGVGAHVPQAAPVGHHLLVAQQDGYRTMPWLEATQTLNGSGPNRRGKYKSAYMIQPFPDNQIAAIWNALTDPTFQNASALLQVDSYGCEVNARASSDTAVPQRSSIMKLQYQAYWNSAGDDASNLNWIRTFYQSVYADTGGEPISNSVTDGCFVNYCDTDLADWPSLYYKDNYARLLDVKTFWDPRNIFNHAQSIGS